jgi:hydrogenase small subunit
MTSPPVPSRRDVIRWIGLTAAAGPVMEAMAGIVRAAAERPSPSPLVWVTGAANHNNFLSQLGNQFPGLLDQIAGEWNLLMLEPWLPAAEWPAPERMGAAPIVILEGLPPVADGNLEPEFKALLKSAKAAVFLGTDASYGGLRHSSEDVRAVEAACKATRTPVIKLPGVPVPPHHLVGTVGHLELLGMPNLDRHRRPLIYYGETVCRRCERRGELENGIFAQALGGAGCLLQLGCKGPITHNSCPVTRWNGGENWCVGAGGPCTGCSEPGFPDHDGLGLYGRLPGDRLSLGSPFLNHLRVIGWGFLGVAAAGLGLRLGLAALDPFRPRRPARSGTEPGSGALP